MALWFTARVYPDSRSALLWRSSGFDVPEKWDSKIKSLGFRNDGFQRGRELWLPQRPSADPQPHPHSLQCSVGGFRCVGVCGGIWKTFCPFDLFLLDLRCHGDSPHMDAFKDIRLFRFHTRLQGRGHAAGHDHCQGNSFQASLLLGWPLSPCPPSP